VRAYANVASFAGATVVRAEQLVPAAGLPAVEAALIGCAVSTGYGVTVNVARVQAGDVVVVFGVGGIGVNVLQTARLLGCGRVVAVDVNSGKAEAAGHFGADEFVVAPRIATAEELVALARGAAGAPVDAAIECSGAAVAIEAAVEVVGRGGTTALVGIPPPGLRGSFDVNALLRNRRIVGSLNGSVEVHRDFPAIVEHVRRGALDLAAQVSAVWPLEAIDDAIAAVRDGRVVRAVLDHTA
jgi:S-(hydroxymethyl)glutathione dehydrogenase/alcohol dehydrogenase